MSAYRDPSPGNTPAPLSGSAARLRSQREYWLQRLAPRVPAAGLPHCADPGPGRRHRHVFALGDDVARGLLALSGGLDQRLLVALVAGLAALVHRYSGGACVALGTGVLRAENLAEQKMAMLPLAIDINEHSTFRDLLIAAKTGFHEALLNQDYPLEKLAAELLPSGEPLFTTAVFLRNIQDCTTSSLTDIDQCWVFVRDGDQVTCIIEVDTRVAGEAFIAQVASHFQALLQGLLAQPREPICGIEFLSPEEIHQLTVTFNGAQKEYPRDTSISLLFEAKAAEGPDRTAIVSGDRHVTYHEVNELANRLAHYLVHHYAIGRGDRVALLLDRSVDAIVAMLAILKCGAAYVPIDTGWPPGRRALILERISASLLITSTDLMFDIEGHAGHVYVTDLQSESLEPNIADPSWLQASAQDIAYIMFTSGTSGEPKGVMVPHRGVIRLVRTPDYVELDSEQRLLLTGSLAFDASTFEIWGMLLNGGTLFLEDQATLLEPRRLRESIARHDISLMWFTSAWFNQLVDENADMFAGLKQILVGGDVLSPAHIERLRQRHPGIRVVNGYGPTENTTFSLCHAIAQSYECAIPIGRPIPNTSAYVVDGNLGLVPLGAWGEILLGGDGLAAGYWNDEVETQRRFVQASLPGGVSATFFRSGDFGRWRPDGVMEFRGRIDSQLKIRGYRVELGEVEQVLLRQDGVRDARVAALGEGLDRHLCAYVVLQGHGNSDAVRVRLKDLLPEYMVPRHVVAVDAFPLTPNGKIDWARLPAPQDMPAAARREPRSATERYLQELWAELLEVDPVCIDPTTNFFDVGGHSLKATLLIARVHHDLGAVVTLNDIFQGPVLQQLASLIDVSSKSVCSPIPRTPIKAHYACSSQQRRMYMLQQMQPLATTYNIPLAFSCAGPLDLSRLQHALQTLVDRHDGLRTSFGSRDGDVVQLLHDDVRVAIEYHRVEGGSDADVLRAHIRAFDLSTAPLLRATVVCRGTDLHLLLLDVHHIVFDGVSLDVFLDGLRASYRGDPLPAPALRYVDYAEWQNGAESRALMQDARDYWLAQFEQPPQMLNLPTVRRRPVVQGSSGGIRRFTIEASVLERLNKLSRENGATLFMTLLGGVFVWLHKVSGACDLVVGTPVAGRTHPDVGDVLGLFVNTLAIRSKVQPNTAWLSYLREIRQTALAAFEHQEYPFDSLVREVVAHRDPSRNPLFDVMFALQNASGSGLELDGLRVATCPVHTGTAKFDLNLWCQESAGELNVVCEFNAELFSPSRVDDLCECLALTLAAVGRAPAQRIADIDVLSVMMKQRLAQRSGIVQPLDFSAALHHRVTLHARTAPDKVAIRCDGESVTYAELELRVNRIAHALTSRGCARGRVVVLHQRRSIGLVIAMLAVHKAGGAHLVIDPQHPDERRAFMIVDSGAGLVVTDVGIELTLPATLPVLDFATIDRSEATSPHPVRAYDPSDLAYVIYTSGSTGRPKGVKVSHGSLENFVSGMNAAFDGSFSADDNCLSITNSSFDVFVAEMVLPLWFGGTLSLLQGVDALNPAAIARTLADEGISFAYLPLVLLEPTLRSIRHNRDDLRLDKLLIGAEPIKDTILLEWRTLRPQLRIVNGYGPTETTICATLYACRDHAVKGDLLPIGSPLPNNRIYLVDGRMRPVPDGSVGEICIGGAGVAAGYLDEALDVGRFIKLACAPGIRFYRSGDLGRWDPDGNLVFVGREDSQIKFRGVRIEPGELEALLGEHEDVREVVVQVRAPGENAPPALVAYYLSTQPIDDARLRAWSRQRIPGYMLPDIFVHLADPPQTASGKIDRNLLPVPSPRRLDVDVPPRTQSEQRIAQHWSRILRIEPAAIGVRTNFFDIGGNSLAVIELMQVLNEEFDRPVRAVDLFALSTIESLAQYFDATIQSADSPIEDFSL